MKTSMKILTYAALVLIALIAVFFLAPLKDWKARKKSYESMATLVAIERESYQAYCYKWWVSKMKIQIHEDKIYDGGMLDELTVTPK